MTVKHDLEAARALIDTPEKWCENGPINRTGGVCIWVATRNAIGCGPRLAQARDALIKALPWWWSVQFWLSEWKNSDAMLIRFNDREKTTHADIMILFDRAIAATEQGGV